MLPPKRYKPYKTRYWCCASCGAELGRIRHHPGSGWMLDATGLRSLRLTGPGAWLLMCEHGHETAWTGDGVNWWKVPIAA